MSYLDVYEIRAYNDQGTRLVLLVRKIAIAFDEKQEMSQFFGSVQ